MDEYVFFLRLVVCLGTDALRFAACISGCG